MPYNWLNTDLEQLSIIQTSNKVSGSDFHTFLNVVDSAANTIIAGPGEGLKYCVTQILVTNAHASVNTLVSILDNAGVAYVGYASAVGGGFAISFPSDNPLMFADDASIGIKCGTTGANVNISINGFIATV